MSKHIGKELPEFSPMKKVIFGTPMRGMVVTVAVKVGQKVMKGDPLLSIEAIKMETMLTAERDATVNAVHVLTGETIHAKDLLLELT